MRLLQNIYLLILGLSFLVSLISFRRRYPVHLRFFSILLGVTLMTEIIALKVLKRSSRNALYNCFMLVEFMAYAWYYRRIIHTKLIRQALGVFLFLFPVCWGLIFLNSPLGQWNLGLTLAGAGLCVSVSLTYFYQVLKPETDIRLRYHTEFWIAGGMLLFYSCQVPYFGGIMNYLNQDKNALKLSLQILNALIVINCVMYLTFTYAFLCRQTHRK